MKNLLSRRKFINHAATGTLAAVSLPQIIQAATATDKVRKIALQPNETIMFQGDSITDWNRNKADTTPNSFAMLGTGYALSAASSLLLINPEKDLKIYNRGISGNKVYQLAERWDADCLAFKPGVVSILVGVNDYWHITKHAYKGTIETYKTDYKNLLNRTRQALPNVKFIIGEPFALKGVKEVDDSWYPAFDAYRQAAREVAAGFDAAFIPYQTIFNEALKTAPGSYWTLDGVHPSVAGTALMAQAWLKAIK